MVDRPLEGIEKHDLPNGDVVYYRESDHSYWSEVKWNHREQRWGGSGRLTGVSSVVKPLDFRPDGLMRYAAKRNGIGIARLYNEAQDAADLEELRGRLAWLGDPDTIWSRLEARQLLFSDHTEQRATEGTNVHEIALHALAQGRPVPDLGVLTAEERGYAQGIIKFWLDHEPRPLQSEQVVYSKKLNVAGRFDLRAALHGPDPYGLPLDGAICLVDAKTSGFIPNKHHAQLSGYDLLAETCGVGLSDKLFILQVDAHGDYVLIEAVSTRQQFLNALQVYRDAAAIGKAAGAARRARAAA